MSRPRRTEFLEKSSYRRRRARDASRVLPFLMLLVFFFPGIWPSEDGRVRLSDAMVFLFVAWCVAIVIAAFLSRYLLEPLVDDPQSDRDVSDKGR